MTDIRNIQKHHEANCACPRAGNCPASRPAVPLAAHILDCLGHWAETAPDRTCIDYYGSRHTFGMLDAQSGSLAARLVRMGLRPGEAAAVFLHNCPQYLTALCGIAKAGGVIVPAYPEPGEADRNRLMRITMPRVIIADEIAWPHLESMNFPRDRVLIVSLASALKEPPLWEPPGILSTRPRMPGFLYLEDVDDPPFSSSASDPGKPGMFICSSGTSGLPKACVHTHASMLRAGQNGIHCLTGAEAGGVGLISSPMYWISGFTTGVLIPIISGLAHVILARWDARAAMRAIDRCGVTFTANDISCYRQMLAEPEPFNLSSLRHSRASSFTGFVDKDARAAWKARTGCMLVSAPYGTTESHTMNTSTLGVEENDRQPTEIFCGYPVRDTVIRILDPVDGKELPLGHSGEIALSAPTLAREYLGEEGSASPAAPDGILRTGDIGRLDERGCLYLQGRLKDLIKVKGKSVAPAEIEAVLQTHPSVERCAVVGRADNVSGQVPVAFVLPVSGVEANADVLQAWCAEKLARYKMPEIRFVDSLPLTPAGKMKRSELAALL